MFDILIRFSFPPIRKSSLLVGISFPVHLSPHPEMAHKMIHYLYQEINCYLCSGVACYRKRKILKYCSWWPMQLFGILFHNYTVLDIDSPYIMFAWGLSWWRVCTRSGLEICLFWSCIDVIVLEVKAIRGIVPFRGDRRKIKLIENKAKCRHLSIFYL